MAYLSVSDGHKLFYEVRGRRGAMPVLFLHGGPGGGCSAFDRTFFDFKTSRVVFFDQRGAGKSRPYASLKANTTAHLIRDIDVLLDRIGLEKVFLFGGSWGSTLALAYAIENPTRVTGMLLRGIFLGTKKENDHYLRGGMRPYFPEIWERFISHVPQRHRKDPARFYLRQMQSRDAKLREVYSYEWAYYEYSIARMSCDEPGREEAKVKALKASSYRSLSPLEAHYIIRNNFMPENHILKNASKITHIPTSIVQGRYDMVCPPEAAFKLHARLENSSLHVVTAGHSARDEAIHSKLVSEMRRMGKLLA